MNQEYNNRFNNNDVDTDDDTEEEDNDSSDSDTEEEDIYLIERKSRYIGVCELYNSYMHGDPTLDGQFLASGIYSFANYNRVYRAIKQIAERDSIIIRNINRGLRVLNHATIRNYPRILQIQAFNKPQIVQCVYLKSGEVVVILKTIYLRIIQRKWKKIYARRMLKYKSIKNILSSRLNGPF